LPGRSEPRRFPLADGDTITGTLHSPEGDARGPLIVLIHGLMGDEDSAYMIEAARAMLTRGRRVLRLNLRGAGSSAALCEGFYYAGCWPDVVAVLDALAPEVEEGFFIYGVSLGGSVTLNLLANMPDRIDCRGGASVCAPIDPLQAAFRLAERRNIVYDKVFVAAMRQAYGKRDYLLNSAMRKGLAAAPIHGYADAREYYAATAGQAMIPRIRVPLLLLHSPNDPWIPADPYLALDLPPHVTLDLSARGGHVGFHGKGGREPWHNTRIAAFLDRIEENGHV
jgi:predicted alpha/beta-fold hydrolase